MTNSQIAADALIRAYLNGRTLPTVLHSAIVRVAETRLLEGCMPVLDDNLRSDIDNEAIAPEGYVSASAGALGRPIMCVVSRRNLRA